MKTTFIYLEISGSLLTFEFAFDTIDLRKDGIIDLNEWSKTFAAYNGKLDVSPEIVSNGLEFYDKGFKNKEVEELYNNNQIVESKFLLRILDDFCNQYNFPMLFEEKSIPVMAYTLETVLAEKYETIIRRNIGTTRARDFYDLHTLYRSRKDEVRPEILKAAVLHTATKRDSLQEMQDYVQILKDIREEPALYLLWNNYVADNKYIGTLGFNEVLDTVDEVAKLLNE